MSDKKISDLVELTSLAADDVLPVVDASANATKRITGTNLSSGIRGDIVSGDMPAGSIVQVVNGFIETEVSHTSSSYVDTGLEATITPTSASNKIFVMFDLNTETTDIDDETGFGLRLLRDSTLIWRADAFDSLAQFFRVKNVSTTNIVIAGVVSGNVLDTPSSTSATTYKLVSATEDDSTNGTVKHQRGVGSSSITLFEVVA